MFSKRVVILALAPSAIAQMSGMATDTLMPTSMEPSMPAEMSTAPSSEEVAGQSTSMMIDNTLSTSTTSAAGMNHSGMAGMGGTHNTTDKTEPPISGSGVSGVSAALFAVSVALSAMFQL
ncbi:hypothetical protein DL764_010847 [Monosporascus ibericus]|uniref:REJ domain-containing protein n=1 Tax=Monosporascus ibericus TaxID=155417 RepID=A0A4Q4SUC8_9PEZI|nr:hypothetical protein DL764_010847 [Monosporascus ibericus]